MTTVSSLPPQVREAIHDLCILVVDNATLKNGIYRAKATALMLRLESTADVTLTTAEIEMAVEMADVVAKAIVDGRALVGARVLMRVVERVITPITEALGYPGHGRN